MGELTCHEQLPTQKDPAPNKGEGSELTLKVVLQPTQKHLITTAHLSNSPSTSPSISFSKTIKRKLKASATQMSYLQGEDTKELMLL